MEVSNHAIKRFLERVKKLDKYNKIDFLNAKKELENLFKNVVSNRIKFVMPKYNKFLAVAKNNKLITILPK